MSTSSLVRWTIQLQVPSTRRASMPVTFWNNPLQPELRKDKPTRTWKSRYQNMMFNPAANHCSKMKKIKTIGLTLYPTSLEGVKIWSQWQDWWNWSCLLHYLGSQTETLLRGPSQSPHCLDYLTQDHSGNGHLV